MRKIGEKKEEQIKIFENFVIMELWTFYNKPLSRIF